MKRLAACVVGILLLVALVLLLSSSNDPTPLRGDSRGGMSHPLSSSVSDPRPAMQFDPRKSYRLEFGRGSGMDGLDTVALDETGGVVLHRLRMEMKEHVNRVYWETATLSINSKTSQRIAELIHDLRIIEMDRAYHADIVDGTQWVFWLIQGEQEKRVYFNNHFPTAIQDFAVAIDEELKIVGLGIEWSRVPDTKAGNHDTALWNSLEDNPDK